MRTSPKCLLPLAFVLAGALALTPLRPPPANAGSGGAAVAGAAAGFVMGVVVGRATAKKSYRPKTTYSTRSGTSKSKSSSRSGGSTRYVRDDATIQQALNAFGHDAGRPDGVFGPKTRAAIQAYQTSIGETPTGELTAAQRAQLLAAYGALVNRNNNKGDDGNDGSGTRTSTASADDFLQRLRQQNADAVPKPAGDTQAPADRSALVRTADAGAATVAFDELCSRFEAQTTESRVIPLNLRDAPTKSDTLLLEQLCTARSYALLNLEADLAALGDLDIGVANDQCQAFTETQADALAEIGREDPDATVAAFADLFGDVGEQRDAVVTSTRVCLGLAYAFDDAPGAVVSAAALTALGEKGYGELVGEHLAMGLGLERNPALGGTWMAWAADAIDEGARPVVDVEGYDRAPLLRVLAEVSADSTPDQTAGQTTDSRAGVRPAGLLLPGMQPANREADAIAFFAAESVAMIKSLETLMLAVGLDRPALAATCSVPDGVSEALSVRVCRALAYASRDLEAMYRYDQMLAEDDDEDAKTRLSLYGALSDQGLSKLAAQAE